MEKTSSTSLLRTKSDQLVETMAAAMAAMRSPASSGDGTGSGAPDSGGGGGGTLSRKSSRRLAAASPGRSSTHIRKSRSAQMKFDLDDLSSGAALSRASSASLGFSFSFTGFTVPPDEIADSKPFSDDDIRKP
nr:ABC transporter G family member 22 isoform X2 [Ipomoea trifida]GMD41671.1 ABC transporter G family member 22 isoform X1 [Ipomoea batatas]